MASIKTHAVVQRVVALRRLLIAAVGDPTVRLEEDSGAEVLLAVPPVGRARCATAGTQNALVEAVEFFALVLRLAVFAALR